MTISPYLSAPMLSALRDLFYGELPRHGNYFVSPGGSKHMARTICSLAKLNYCRVVTERPGRAVARLNKSVHVEFDIAEVEARLAAKAAKRRGDLAAEADALAEREMA